jgi:glycopeptide antibiotics resistance protein
VTQTVDRSTPVPGRAAASGGARDGVRDDDRAGTWLWALGLALYSALVLAVVAWPQPVDSGAHGSLESFFGRLHAAGVPEWVGYGLLEASANVVMFAPLGFLVTRLRAPRWWWGVLAPAALSVGAEAGQALLRPERVATWADVAANTGGAALGTAAALVLMGRGRPASRASRPRPGRIRHRAGSPSR